MLANRIRNKLNKYLEIEPALYLALLTICIGLGARACHQMDRCFLTLNQELQILFN
jgi:hypothetical protein